MNNKLKSEICIHKYSQSQDGMNHSMRRVDPPHAQMRLMNKYCANAQTCETQSGIETQNLKTESNIKCVNCLFIRH